LILIFLHVSVERREVKVARGFANVIVLVIGLEEILWNPSAMSSFYIFFVHQPWMTKEAQLKKMLETPLGWGLNSFRAKTLSKINPGSGSAPGWMVNAGAR
jgi:hypothetical protein